MPENGDEGRWVFRRLPTLWLPADAISFRTREGIKALRPEVQLLYKAKDVRTKDEADFRALLPTLDRSQKVWLVDALEGRPPRP